MVIGSILSKSKTSDHRESPVQAERSFIWRSANADSSHSAAEKEAGWWFLHPSEKYESQLIIGMIIPNIWENKKWQPNHQPGSVTCWNHRIVPFLFSEDGGTTPTTMGVWFMVLHLRKDPATLVHTSTILICFRFSVARITSGLKLIEPQESMWICSQCGPNSWTLNSSSQFEVESAKSVCHSSSLKQTCGYFHKRVVPLNHPF